jgi:membrane protease YdiL (CAAX protease family)
VMTDKKKNIVFVVCTFAFFWGFLVVGIGGIGSLIGEELLLKLFPFGVIIGAWAPNIALLVLFKILYPGSTVKEFIKNAFKERLNIKLLSAYTIVHLFVFVAAVSIVASIKEISFSGLFDLSLPVIGMGFVWTLTQGATGEEAGWRGFLQPSLEKKYSVIRSSIIIGIIWAFWHTPLWFVTSGYAGTELLWYIAVFIFQVMALSIMIGICYNRCKNLVVPIWIHFLSNFIFTVFAGDAGDFLHTFTCLTAFYIIAAAGYIIWFKKCIRKSTPVK